MTSPSTPRLVRVLIVDDNPVDAELVRLALKNETAWSTDVIVAEDGEKAIQLLTQQAAQSASNRSDFVVLDLNIPKRDGTEVLQMIRATPGLKSMPVAIFSSSPMDVIQKKLTEAGVVADGHFTKPSELEQYLNFGKVLRHWLENL